MTYFICNFILCVWVFSLMFVHGACFALRREDDVRSLELGLQVVVSCHMSAGNCNPVLWKNSHCS